MKASPEPVAIYIKEVTIYERYIKMPLQVWEKSDFSIYTSRSPYYKTIRKCKSYCICKIIGSLEELASILRRLRKYGEVTELETIERPVKERRIVLS